MYCQLRQRLQLCSWFGTADLQLWFNRQLQWDQPCLRASTVQRALVACWLPFARLCWPDHWRDLCGGLCRWIQLRREHDRVDLSKQPELHRQSPTVQSSNLHPRFTSRHGSGFLCLHWAYHGTELQCCLRRRVFRCFNYIHLFCAWIF